MRTPPVITHQAKGYQLEVVAPAGCGVHGIILADHLKSVGWKGRRAERAGHCTPEVTDEVRAHLAPLLGF